MKTKGRLFLVGAAVVWALAGVCVKSITWGPLPLISVKALLTVILFCCIQRSVKVRFTKKNVLAALFNAGMAIAEVFAIKMTTAGNAIVLQYIAPILIFLFSVIFQHKKAGKIQILLTFVIFSGIILAFASDLDATHIVGNIFGVLCGICYAGYIIMANDPDTSVSGAIILSNLINFLITLPFLFTDSSVVFDATNIIWLLILSFVQFGLGSILFEHGIKRVDSVEGSVILALEPVLNPIIVAVVVGERMNALGIIGAAIVISGVVAYTVLNKEQN